MGGRWPDAEDSDEHGEGHTGDEAGEGDGVHADDEDDDMCDAGETDEYAAGLSGAEPSPAAGALSPGGGSDGGEASHPAACEACDESARAAEAAASAHVPAAAAHGDGAAAAQPAGRGEDEQPKRKKMRVRGGRAHWARDHDDD